EMKILQHPDRFIHSIPHMSFVIGKENVAYLKKRYETMRQNHLFDDMVYSEAYQQIKEWIPLVMQGRKKGQHIAATRMDIGTDVNFGSLTRAMLDYLAHQPGVKLKLAHEVRDIEQRDNGHWLIEVKNSTT